MEYLKAHYRAWEITSLSVPSLGCGAGQLAWREVHPMLHTNLAQLHIPVEVYMTKTQVVAYITLSLGVGRRVVTRAMDILEEQGSITFGPTLFDARVQRISQEDGEKVIANIKEHI